MSLTAVMGTLSRSEIKCGMASMYAAGFRVWLGDERNGIRAVAEFRPEDLDGLAAEWLIAEAKKHFPHAALPGPQTLPANVIPLGQAHYRRAMKFGGVPR